VRRRGNKIGFGSGAFQAARIAIDGVTIIENIVNGKIQTTTANESSPTPVISSPSTGTAWGYAGYIVVNSKQVNAVQSLSWITPSHAVSLFDAVALTGSTATIDGTASNYNTGGSSVALSLTTTNAADVIIVFVTYLKGSSGGNVTISDTAGLTWTLRTSVSQSYGSSGLENIISEFYAVTTSVLTNDTITVSGSSGNNFFAEAFGINGANTSSPFDPNNSLVGEYTSYAAEVTSLSTALISTTDTNTMLLSYWGGDSGSTGFANKGGTGVQSLTNTDGTLTLSQSTGAVVASMSLTHANTWTGLQTFNSAVITPRDYIQTDNITSSSTDNQITFSGNASISYPQTMTIQINDTVSLSDNIGQIVCTFNGSSGTTFSLKAISGITPVTGLEITALSSSSASAVTSKNTIDDGTGNTTRAGYNKTNLAQTTLTGTTAGSVVWSQPEQGSAYKKFVAFANGYENTTATAQTVTFSTAFTNTPIIIGNSTGMTITASTTTLTLPASMSTTASGMIIIEGY
jgi:hypothetical protein